jgi:hypothetical protein
LAQLRQLTEAALHHDYARVDALLARLGVRNTDNTPEIPADFYVPWISIILSAFAETPFDFATATLHEDALKQARKSLKYWDAFQLSPDTMLVDRAITGHYWTMKQLGVNAAFRSNLQRALEHH